MSGSVPASLRLRFRPARAGGDVTRRSDEPTMASEHWKEEPEAEDFPSAESYLSLLVGLAAATKLAKALRKQKELTRFAAKDILRASGLPLLAADDSEVSSDLEKIKLGKQLSPVLLIQ